MNAMGDDNDDGGAQLYISINLLIPVTSSMIFPGLQRLVAVIDSVDYKF